MDIGSLAQGMTLLKSALDALKQAKELMPDSSQKEGADIALIQAERQLKIAEGEIAGKLQYELCRNHFPPEIMLSSDDKVWMCPNCDNKKDNRRTATFKTL
jgi:hypothetical protein